MSKRSEAAIHKRNIALMSECREILWHHILHAEGDKYLPARSGVAFMVMWYNAHAEEVGLDII